MNLRTFAYFMAIAEEKSISKAANKLYVSQPSLSHFLSNLENELEVRLFERRKNQPLSMTPAGESFYVTAKGILEQWEDFQQTLHLHQEGVQKHKMALGVAHQDCPAILDIIIPKLNERYPDVEIDILHGGPAVLQQKVLDGEIDIGYSAYSKQLPQLQYYRMENDEVDLIVPLEHPMAKRSYLISGNESLRITLEEVRETPLVLTRSGTVMRSVENSYFREISFKPNVRIATDHTVDSINIVRQLKCFGFCPRINREQALGKVALLALSPPMYYGGGIYYKKGADLSPVAKDFVSLIESNFPSL